MCLEPKRRAECVCLEPRERVFQTEKVCVWNRDEGTGRGWVERCSRGFLEGHSLYFLYYHTGCAKPPVENRRGRARYTDGMSESDVSLFMPHQDDNGTGRREEQTLVQRRVLGWERESGHGDAAGSGLGRGLVTIAAEANLLRLPLFALSTKGLKSLEGFECRGQSTRNGEAREFLFRTARSTATLYPGPLSRSAHLAFLSLVTEHGLPIANPITWSWRELCRRMGTSASGREVQQLKRAIEATAGLTIFSRDAVYSKPEGQTLKMTGRGVAHLYEQVVFLNEELPGGGTADTNYLWLAPWYLENLNALFTAPLDHELWRFLDKQSTIASRLYEFLLINFYNGMPQLRINYPKLAQFLPVKPERYLSDARKQFEPALALLKEVQLTGQVRWQKRAEGVALMEFDRGNRLDRAGMRTRLSATPAIDVRDEELSVTEIRQAPEREVVRGFYRLWLAAGERQPEPTPKELGLALEFLSRFGKSRMKGLLPLVVNRLRQKWPGAKTFLAVESYLGEVAAEESATREQERRRTERQRREHEESAEVARKEIELKRFEAEWLPVWNGLSETDKNSMRERIQATNPMFRHTPGMLLSRCLDLLAKESKSPGGGLSAEGETPLRTARNARE